MGTLDDHVSTFVLAYLIYVRMGIVSDKIVEKIKNKFYVQ